MNFALAILTFSQKSVLKQSPVLNIFQLTLFGTGVCFASQIFFQLFLSFTNDTERLYYFLQGLAVMTIYFGILSFFVAFQLKTKKTGRLVLFILGFVVLLNVITRLFPTLIKP